MPGTISLRKKQGENTKGLINVFGEEKKCDPLQQNLLTKKHAYLHVSL